MAGLDQFEAIIERFGKITAFAIGGSALVPLVSAASGLAPEWPTGLPFLASLLMLLTLAATFHFLTVDNRRIFSAVFLFGALAFLVSMTAHIYLYSTFTSESVQGEEKIILGCEWTPGMVIYASSKGIDSSDQCPGDFRPLIEAADGDPAEVYTPASIRRVAFSIAATWLMFFVSLAFVLGSFVIWYAGQPGRRASRRRA